MDCAEVRLRVIAGPERLPADAARHAEECPACRALLDDQGALGRVLDQARPPAPTAPDLALLGGELDRALARERGARGWLRERGRPARLALVIAVLGVEVAAMLAAGGAPGARVRTPAELVVTLAFFGVLLVAASWHALRPLYLPPAPSWLTRGLVVLGVLAPFAIALWSGSMPAPDAPGGFAARYGVSCFAMGAGIGVALLLVARALDRGGHRAAPGALLAAAAAGLAANVALDLHCASLELGHLAVGHAGVAVVLVAAYAMIRRAGGRPGASPTAARPHE